MRFRNLWLWQKSYALQKHYTFASLSTAAVEREINAVIEIGLRRGLELALKLILRYVEQHLVLNISGLYTNEDDI